MLVVCFDLARGLFRPRSSYVSTVLKVCFNRSRCVSTVLDVCFDDARCMCFDRDHGMFQPCSSTVLEVCFDRAR